MRAKSTWWLVGLALCASGAWAEGTVNLVVGTKSTVTVPGIKRVAIGDVSICDARPLGGGVLELTPVSEGKTTLMVWTLAGGKEAIVTYTLSVTDPAHADEVRLHVKVGEVMSLDLKDIDHVAVGDADVADVSVRPNGILVTGRAEGDTNLLVWDKSNKRKGFKVQVEGSGPAAADAVEGEPWSLSVGATREVPRPARVGISDWDVCHLEDTPKAIVLRGHAAGTAEVTVSTADGKRTRHVLTVK